MSHKVHKSTAKERRRAQIVAFVGHLLASPTIDEAARKTGISGRTASRWLHSAEFASAYRETREATLQSLSGLLRASSIGAVERLASVVRNPLSPDTAAVNACKSILDSLLRVVEAAELEKRVAQLEAASAEEQTR